MWALVILVTIVNQVNCHPISTNLKVCLWDLLWSLMNEDDLFSFLAFVYVSISTMFTSAEEHTCSQVCDSEGLTVIRPVVFIVLSNSGYFVGNSLQ